MSSREIKRTALVTFSPEQMFDLVVDVERYCEFLPWVAGAEVHEKTGRDLQASLVMERAGIRQTFTTRNVMQRPDWMSLELVSGPFKQLDGLWTFTAIGTAGTKVVLDMKFEFANPVASMLFGRAFEQSVGELIDAFVARARQVHGAGS
ncbi:MAG: type II toxin-antitoxin system RatA family toxin [Gammaproteobacteria bacterium]|nr:type II toxin-antitoxin system RatA family toxin [Gammaproteobacteria bacterium]MDH4312469.1 type II toxin-antitoxin system RatA family toxin [Gammaproteobacteria bacterium]MDH5274330.1 type II toxin-antitoxin system RatA family toxin [Gammaproteobacteria bacterium]